MASEILYFSSPLIKASRLQFLNAAAVELGRLGGRKGGAARAASLTPEQRSEIARKAAQTRWLRKKEGQTA